jgi:hypothetical protein
MHVLWNRYVFSAFLFNVILLAALRYVLLHLSKTRVLPQQANSIESPDDGQGTPETCRNILNKISTV